MTSPTSASTTTPPSPHPLSKNATTWSSPPTYAPFLNVSEPSKSDSPVTYRWISKHPDTRYTPIFVTYFTLVHFLTGASFYHLLALTVPWSLGVSFFVWSVLHLFYEWKDIWFSYVEKAEGYNYEHSLFNTIGDQLFAVAGFLFAWAMRKRLGAQTTFVILLVALAVGVIPKLE